MKKNYNVIIICATILAALFLLRGQTLVVNVHHTIDLKPELKK